VVCGSSIELCPRREHTIATGCCAYNLLSVGSRPPECGLQSAAGRGHANDPWRLTVRVSKAFPSVQSAEILKCDSDVWRTMMDAALRVHRYHAAKVEGSKAQSAEPSERSAGQGASESAPSGAPSG
jgi:hypothetical protein